MSEKIIAAIATGQSPGGIGIVRISGEGACQLADKVFSRSREGKSGGVLSESEGYRAYHGYVRDGGGWSDEVVAVVYRAPRSYTGEDVVELCCHGGAASTKLTLRACIDAGARPAAAGEFTQRAFENGKLSLTQAEAVMSIISAEGRQAALAAQAAHSGALYKKLEALTAELTALSVSISAWCDYPDEEEIPAVTTQQLTDGLGSALAQLDRLIANGDAGRLLRDGIDTVICGRPNVGKSTLMNLLAGCEKSIVTEIPGTTRDIVQERIVLGNCVLALSDTAGLRDTDDVIEQIGVDRARRRMDECALVIAVFDGSQPLDEEDKRLIERVSGRPCVAVINKTDKQQRIDSEYIINKIQHTVFLSASLGEGLDSLEKAVMEATKLNHLDPSSGIIINERQLDCARRARDAVKEALDAAVYGVTFDAVNVSIGEGIAYLLELSGERVSDRIVDGVFAQFCVGK